jgi:phosphoesterase RecJ-like protein
MLEGLNAFKDVLATAGRVLISTHVNPDGDAVGSLLGLRRVLRAYGVAVTAVLADPVPVKYRFLADEPVPGPRDDELARSTTTDPFDLAVFIDASELERVGEVAERFAQWCRPGAPLVNIDHHIGNTGFGDIVIVDPGRASSGELVLEVADVLGVTIDPVTARQLYAAVLTDTGRFQFSNTNEASLCAAGRLVRAGADPQTIAERIYFERPAAFYRLLGHLFEHMTLQAEGRICVFAVSREETAAFFRDGHYDSEGIVDFTVQVEGVEIGAFLRQTGERIFRASLRSRGEINVRAIAETFGGGGHEKAAGCTLEGEMPEVRERLIAAMTRSLE